MKKAYVNYRIHQEKQSVKFWSTRRKRQCRSRKLIYKKRMAENVPNVERDLSIQFHEAHTFPNKFNLKIILQDIL